MIGRGGQVLKRPDSRQTQCSKYIHQARVPPLQANARESHTVGANQDATGNGKTAYCKARPGTNGEPLLPPSVASPSLATGVMRK